MMAFPFDGPQGGDDLPDLGEMMRRMLGGEEGVPEQLKPLLGMMGAVSAGAQQSTVSLRLGVAAKLQEVSLRRDIIEAEMSIAEADVAAYRADVNDPEITGTKHDLAVQRYAAAEMRFNGYRKLLAAMNELYAAVEAESVAAMGVDGDILGLLTGKDPKLPGDDLIGDGGKDAGPDPDAAPPTKGATD